MSKVDWSLAPEGATHWTPDRSVCNQFLKFDKEWFWFREGWVEYGDGSDWMERQLAGVISRPEAEQAKQWSGPQDGLPPVNTECDALDRMIDTWVKVKIVDHQGSVDTAACRAARTDRLFWAQDFRPIKTSAQLAAEKRETSIREIMDVAGIDCLVAATKLVDAGFTREVV